ncbi:MAG: ATP synthase F1 subunit delta [Candidatus Handelsmanbacteria bacterium RIFCSPLOWO2_12_FULL_64_10]|uniref:ATP synthase subunit delta n=1 Tax=Handelsmanbacteria sp. (strain RIFCSPLOWO2_12_FULL_64_10) TaxID=1817868 RepID=A0A1F6C5P1_HANXR|nr:MAG: ATP synthase F1 subunit delta [Candidatus Handelsmanbacteria bacterium RIFCSPLOWO2_12_FULL_64_10]
MRETAVSQRYAKALLEAAESQKTLDRVSRDVAGVIDLIDASEDLKRLLESPMVHPKSKRDALTALFSDKIAPLTLNFLLLLVERRRERVTEGILRQFVVYMEEREGVVTAEVQASQPLSQEQQEAMIRGLSSYLNQRVRLRIEVSPQIRAGFVARVGDVVFDGTIETQLQQLRARLAGI